MSNDNRIDFILTMRKHGAKRVAVDGSEVEFGESGEVNIEMLERAIEQGRQEILSKLTDSERERLEHALTEALVFGSS